MRALDPGRAGWAAVWMVALLVCAPVARAEPLVDMERPRTSLTFAYDWTDESLHGPSIDRVQRVRLSRAGLKISTKGYVYHRDFLRYFLRLHPEWHAQTATGTVSRNDRAGFLGYLVNADVLEHKRLGLNLSTQRRRAEFSSSLSPNRITRASAHRASLHLRSRILPSSLNWELNHNRSENFYVADETSRALRLESRYPGRENNAFLQLADIRQERRVDGSVSRVDSLQGALGGHLTLAEDWHLNGSVISNRNDSGVTDLNYLMATTRLDGRHTEHLSSHYQVQFNRRDTGGFRSDGSIAEAGLRHRLFENLTTTATVRASETDQSIGRTSLHEAGVHFNYVRRIPWGRVGATHGQRLYLDEHDITSPLTPVFDESHTLTGVTPSYLTHPFVDGTTVQVTDLTGTIVYTPGIDYTLTVVGSSTGVVRDPLGGIASGQQVLVDYSYASQLPYTVTRRTIHTGVTLELWEAVHLFAQTDTSDISLRSGVTPTNIGDDRVTLLGTEVQVRSSTTRLEFEDRHTAVTPSTRLLVREQVRFPVGRKSAGGASAERVMFRYPGTGEWTMQYSLSGDLRRPVFQSGTVEVRATLRDTRGTLQRSSLGQFSAMWKWRLGDWNGSLGVDTLRERNDLAAQTRSRDRIVLQAARVF